MRILVFGDSIAQGFFDSQGGWVQRLINEYHKEALSAMLQDQNEYVEMFNLGVSGDTAAGVLARMETEIKARRLYADEEVIVIAVGVNDSILQKNLVAEDEYNFQQTMEKVIATAKDLSKHVLCVGLTPVEEALTDPWKFSSTGKQWKNNRIDLFEDTIKYVAEQAGVTFVPIYDGFVDQLNQGILMHSDGLHPNDTGHKFIADTVKPHLEKFLV